MKRNKFLQFEYPLGDKRNGRGITSNGKMERKRRRKNSVKKVILRNVMLGVEKPQVSEVVKTYIYDHCFFCQLL